MCPEPGVTTIDYISLKSAFSAFENTIGVNIAVRPAVSVPASAGKTTVGILPGLQNAHNYNVLVTVTRNGVDEQYLSDSFRISGC
ncbi:2532_t:CDS:2 [Paraglomus occultum]|uniref:2532_t:CDS:1 n=1 Tax=Paraglomus occultum TaxID=144539 RepID=A0A9N9G1P5_9GLOM|nr:2532_t:CDS:2 [Paraglomus occultum]